MVKMAKDEKSATVEERAQRRRRCESRIARRLSSLERVLGLWRRRGRGGARADTRQDDGMGWDGMGRQASSRVGGKEAQDVQEEDQGIVRESVGSASNGGSSSSYRKRDAKTTRRARGGKGGNHELPKAEGQWCSHSRR